MAKAKCFMDRVMADVSKDLIFSSAHFVRALANRLEGDRLSVRVRTSDIADHFGEDVSFVRAAIALSQMTRYWFTFEKKGQYRDCPLIVFVDYDVDERIMQVYFTQEGRTLLQDWGWEWTLRMVPDIG